MYQKRNRKIVEYYNQFETLSDFWIELFSIQIFRNNQSNHVKKSIFKALIDEL